MAIPYTFARVKPQDFTLTPFPVHKKYYIDSANLTSTASGYSLLDAVHTSKPTPVGASQAANDPTNSFDNSYQHIIWHSINRQWYKFPYDSMSTLEHANKRYTFKFLNYSASQLAIPYMAFGEGIKPRSVVLTNQSYGYTLVDDVNGNLYDPSISTSSYATIHSLVGYWGFNDQFKRFRYREGNLSYGQINFASRTFEPDDTSYASNVRFDVGVKVNGSGSGMAANFSGDGYILTHDRPHFNFPTNEDFTLSMWVRVPISQSVLTHDTNSIISKRGVKRKLVYGVEDKYTKSDTIISTAHYSSSIADELIDVYPYDVSVYNSTVANNGKILFRRSTGVSTLQLVSTASINDGRDHHIAITKNSNTIKLYIDGHVNSSGSDVSTHPLNDHALMFGAVNRAGLQAYSGSLDEVRIYEYGATSASILTLADNISGSCYQTAIAGNVFYRSGNVIVSPLNPKYNTAFKGTWNMAYRGTHTIYQYEVLCRIKAGSFLTTTNPTARVSPKSDLLINNFTGSNEILMPYFTEIGLYSTTGELVAVAKMGQPIARRSDVDTHVLIRFDA